MSSGEIVAYIVVPLGVFLLGAAGTGVVGIVKLASYFASSRDAQVSTAASNEKIAERLDKYMQRTDGAISNHGERIGVLEYAVRGKRDDS